MNIRLMTFHLFVVSLVANCTMAHNGSIFVASAVDEIVIDGELSDWPEIEGYAIAVPYVFEGNPNSDDFTGVFRVGCNHHENALYVAVAIQDDTIVLDGFGTEWSSWDACEVFLVVNHSENDVVPFQFVYRDKPVVALADEVNPEAGKAMKVARASDDGRIIYEWRIDLNELSGGERSIASGAVFGFDVGYIDRDSANDVAVYSSTPGRRKHLTSYAHGDLVVPDKDSALYRLQGRTAWSQPGPSAPSLLTIQSASDTSIFFQLPLGGDGKFSVPMPPGNYRLTAFDNRAASKTSQPLSVEVRADTLLQEPVTIEVATAANEDVGGVASTTYNVVHFDLAHGEQMSDQLRNFAAETGMELRPSRDSVTKDLLEGVELIYIRMPQSEFSKDEQATIIEFVQSGGSLLVVLDEERRTRLADSRINGLLKGFELGFGDDIDYVHNCGGIAKSGAIHQRELEIPFSGGRSVEGGTPFAFELDENGEPSQPFATYKELKEGGRIVIMGEGMATLFLGTSQGERLTGVPRNPRATTYWGKDSFKFNEDLFNWLLRRAE